MKDDVAVFDVPTTFLGNYVEQNFGDVILHKLSEAQAQIRRILFQVAARQTDIKKPLEAPERQDTPKSSAAKNGCFSSEFTSAPIDARFTFDTFIVGKPNELAYAASKRVSEGGEVTFNPLFLYGGVGLGKTHLMHATAWELQARRPDLNVLYLSAEQFMYRFVQALR